MRSDLREAIYGLPGLSERRLGCSPELEDVIMSLLHLDPARRPGSAAEVLARVGSVVSGGSFDAATFAAEARLVLGETLSTVALGRVARLDTQTSAVQLLPSTEIYAISRKG